VLAYHGTAADNIEKIKNTGLLVPGKFYEGIGTIGHATDTVCGDFFIVLFLVPQKNVQGFLGKGDLLEPPMLEFLLATVVGAASC
jgi:hypothetical protein